MTRQEYENEIMALKHLLKITDYVVLKAAEAELYGEDTTRFNETINNRRNWREKLNEYEKALSNLPLESETIIN